MNLPRTLPTFLLLTLLVLPAVAAAQVSDTSFPVAPDVVVDIRNLVGKVDVLAWSDLRVRVIVHRRGRAVETTFEQTANRVLVHTHLLQPAAPPADRVVNYEIWAPSTARVKVRVESGAVRVENFSSDVSLEAVKASVLLANLSGHTSVDTLNGSLQADRCSGRLEASSVSGNLRFFDNESRDLDAKTTSGDIFYQGDFLPGGSYEFVSHEGSIELRVGEAASFELAADTVQGSVENELLVRPRARGRMPRPDSVHSLLGVVRAGDALVRVQSFSGTIRLRKR